MVLITFDCLRLSRICMRTCWKTSRRSVNGLIDYVSHAKRIGAVFVL